MKKEYDFSKGERGKFYSRKARLNLPIYLEPETHSFVESIAEKIKSDISQVVNDLIKVPEKLTLNKKNARKAADTEYNWENQEKKLLLLYKKLEKTLKRR